MLHEVPYFLAMLLFALAILKIAASFLMSRDPNSRIAHGIDWFLTPA